MVSIAQISMAQNVKLRNAASLRVDPSISQAQLKQIIKTVENTLNEYTAASKLIDLDQKRVTEKSIDRFNKLFTPNAKVVKDYAEFVPMELMSYRSYSREVYNMFKLKGVEYVIQSAELVEVKSTALGFYEPIVMVNKKMYSYLTADGATKSIPSGRLERQKFRFDILKDDPTRANISRIDHAVTLDPPDEYTRIFSVSAGVGSSSYSPSTSSYWDQAHRNSSLDVKGGIDFSIGAELVMDKFLSSKTSSNRPLAFSVGLRYASHQVKTELRSFSIEPFEQTAVQDTASNRYWRHVGPVTGDESIRFSTLEIPLGVAYKLMKKQTSMVFLHARFIPSFVIGGSGNLKGNGFYDGILINEDASTSGLNTASQMRILRMIATDQDKIKATNGWEPYKVGRDEQIDLDADPELSGSTFAIQLSPTGYFNFSDDNPSWGVMIGLDLTYRFGSFIKHNPVDSTLDNALKYTDDFEGSLMSYYTEKVSGFHYGVRIGLFQRLGIDP